METRIEVKFTDWDELRKIEMVIQKYSSLSTRQISFPASGQIDSATLTLTDDSAWVEFYFYGNKKDGSLNSRRTSERIYVGHPSWASSVLYGHPKATRLAQLWPGA